MHHLQAFKIRKLHDVNCKGGGWGFVISIFSKESITAQQIGHKESR